MTKSIKRKFSDILTFRGCTIVEGVPVDVLLSVDTVALIHELGAKAARSKGGKSMDARGLVRVKVSANDAKAVRDAKRRKRLLLDEQRARERIERNLAKDASVLHALQDDMA